MWSDGKEPSHPDPSPASQHFLETELRVQSGWWGWRHIALPHSDDVSLWHRPLLHQPLDLNHQFQLTLSPASTSSLGVKHLKSSSEGDPGPPREPHLSTALG